ncbi:MAG: Arm DNA-binding domain-containing protein [Pseudomonadales bacterium]
MALTDTKAKQAKPKDKTYRLSDERGMYLEITKAGGKYWRLKYRYGGKEKRLAIGVYPEVSLKQARDLRDAARIQLKDGIDPSAHKRAMKHTQGDQVANSFKAVAKEWYKQEKAHWSESHASRVSRALRTR